MFVTNLSDTRDQEGKILKKQLKLICLLSANGRKFSKTQGIEILKKPVMQKFMRIHKTAFSDKGSLNIYLKQIRAKFLGQSFNNTYDL